MPAETALMSSAFDIEDLDNGSPATSRASMARQTSAAGSQHRSSSPIRDCEVTTIELPWNSRESLGISFVGGSDTPLVSYRVLLIYLTLVMIECVH